jgi:kynurenine formamidase
MPPYLSPEAVLWIVEQGIEHLIVDLPSVDRVEDGGHLAAHRVFFGLPAGGRDLDQARRARCTITELAYIADEMPDGEYLLTLQVPAISGDAVPSRPLLYALEAESP